MKKRLLFFTILCLSLIMVFAACGDDDNSGNSTVIEEVDGVKLELSNDGTHYTVVGTKSKFSKSLTIPEKHNSIPVTAIGEQAFFGCTALSSISVPNGVTSIGKEAFAHCTGLFSVTLPGSLKSIGDKAFDGCSKLIEVCNQSTLNIAQGNDDFGGIAKNALVVCKNNDGNDAPSVDRMELAHLPFGVLTRQGCNHGA